MEVSKQKMLAQLVQKVTRKLIKDFPLGYLEY